MVAIVIRMTYLFSLFQVDRTELENTRVGRKSEKPVARRKSRSEN